MPNDIAAKNAAKTKAEKPTGAGKPKVERGGDSFFTKVSRFVRESYIEVVKKAAWPSWPELKKFTTVVIIAVLIIGVWIGGLDYLLGRFISDPLLRNSAGNTGIPR